MPRTPLLRILGLSAGLLSLIGCTGVPRGVSVEPNVQLNRYLGTWYEIARLDHRFERGLVDVTAEYTLLPDHTIRVLNRGYHQTQAIWKQATGRARRIGNGRDGRLKVSFFRPFYGGYHIIALPPETGDTGPYAWSMVCGPNRQYLWILARTPNLDPAIHDQLIARARSDGFDVDNLIQVPHGIAPARADQKN